MRTTKTKLMESINVELKTVLRERYLRSQIHEVVGTTESQVSTEKMEGLLEKVLDALENIDLSIDYLTSAITGHDPFAISIAQKVAGRGGVGTKPAPRAAMERPVDEALNPNKTLAAHTPEDFEDPEEDPEVMRSDSILGLGPGEWKGSQDSEPQQQRPPREYRRQAIKILASFNIDVGQQAIDILAWELANAAASAETEPMEDPASKPSWLQKVLRKAIREDLKAHMGQHALREAEQGQVSAVRHFTQGMPYEVESILIQLIDRYGFDLDEAEQLANELKRMQGSELEDEPPLAQYVKKEEKNNPWAICTSSVGREDKEKYEKCVKSIKAKNRGK